MSQMYGETEHQEIFFPAADLRRPINVHIPSALGKLGYYLFVRVDSALAGALAAVEVKLTITGLRSFEVQQKFGEGNKGPATFASKQAAKTWVCLGRLMASRGEGPLTIANLPQGLEQADVLLCTWTRFVSSGQADDWLACQADPQWAPTGVPLGGIGCGKVEICRDGRFRNFSGNNNQDMPFEDPDGLEGAYLSIALGEAQRVLATRAAAGKGGLIPPVANLQADLAFPQATLRAAEVFPGIDVEATLSGMLCPHDLKTSGLPGFIVRFRVSNRTGQPVRIACRMAWPNLVGFGGGIGEAESRIGYGDGFYRYWTAPDQPACNLAKGGDYEAIRYGNEPSEISPAADGFHFVAVRRDSSVLVEKSSRTASVAKEMTVPAGGSATADMAVVWDMPHWIDIHNVDRGHLWQNHFAGGEEILDYIFKSFDTILAAAGQLPALLKDTSLPAWLKRRLANCCYPLVTNSVLYKDGRFSVNEGPTEMAACFGTIDQRLAAHAATLLLFPQLNWQELEEFSLKQADNGGVNHDLGQGHLEAKAVDSHWPDLTCSFIIQWASHVWSNGATEIEELTWQRAKKALLRHAEWAQAGGGVAQIGHGLGTSYDGYHYIGTVAYVATLWLAALEVARKWATKFGDRDLLPRLDAWEKQARERLEADLWNGRFYRAYNSPQGPANENCHAGMLAGEYYSRMLAGVDVLGDDRLQACADAMVQLNGNAKFAVPPDEVSADLKEFTQYGWLPYVESFCLAPLAIRGDGRMMDIWRRIIEAMDPDGKSPCDTRLMYQPVSGKQSWGSYYMTAPASWLVYQATLDFFYWPAEGVLRLSPMQDGRFAIVHPLFWATAQRQGGSIRMTIRKTFGRTPRLQGLELPPGAREAKMGGKALAAAGAMGKYKRFACPATELAEGATIEWTVE